MQLRNREYSYPVVAEGNDSYITSNFQADVTVEKDGYNIKFLFEAKINNESLERLIAEGKASYVFHFECPKTRLRIALKSTDGNLIHVISDRHINGLVQICPFIVAQTEIQAYKSDQFSLDYKEYSFNIDKGCIMAIGNQINVLIDKDRDDLTNTSSIFSIVRNMDPGEVNVLVNINDEKIRIRVPDVSYSRYEAFSGHLLLQPVMHQMLILPALMHTFEELKRSINELYIYEDYRWFRSLKKTASKFNTCIDEDGLASLDAFKLAQQLLDTPLTRALEFLTNEEDESEN